MRTVRQQLNEMVTRNGKTSNAKVWAFIGCAVATWIMIYMTIKDKMGWEMFVVYLASVAGFSQLSKVIAYKYGGSTTTTTTATADTSVTTIEKCPDCATKPKKEDEGQD